MKRNSRRKEAPNNAKSRASDQSCDVIKSRMSKSRGKRLCDLAMASSTYISSGVEWENIIENAPIVLLENSDIQIPANSVDTTNITNLLSDSETFIEAEVNTLELPDLGTNMTMEVVLDNNPELASYNSPKALVFNQDVHSNLTTFLEGLENIFKSYGLDKKDDEVKVAILLNIAGQEAQKKFKNFSLSEEDKKKFEVVVNVLMEYRTTPLTGIGLSPSELLNNRVLMKAIPVSQKVLSKKPIVEID
ncbi:unnamed protein product [Diabrotica balteata]|uniref:Uncharacterized protein n=1 Tax=Diabrotica balteata TaxID=107213 RepID=A0A9N9XAQ8_DIABA|nr:unnamed protein product [Diabrotica balteata]